jgi:hypothetical protein
MCVCFRLIVPYRDKRVRFSSPKFFHQWTPLRHFLIYYIVFKISFKFAELFEFEIYFVLWPTAGT